MGNTKKVMYNSTFVLFICLSVSLLAGCRIETHTEETKVEETKGEEQKGNFVTLEQYDLLEKGMSYEEVTDILGASGKPMMDESDESTTKVYAWDGEQTKSFISVTFKNGKLTTKEKFGIN
ncbi:DUF3862 domain-containing protein [Rossellomorea marisflavi]|uniref:DUF3862 domain-containing protein n=1 Tax=Rossellomorea marisflavi TaxID=189381 RepID=UPI003459B7F7